MQTLTIARQLLSLPTAPYRENKVQDYIKHFLEQRKITFKQDAMGNIIAIYGPSYKNPVLAFSAHMDHPGFIMEKDSVNGKTTALFYGGVEQSYFKNTQVRIYSSKGPITGIITKTSFNPEKQIKRVWLQVKGQVARGDTGMWHLPPVKLSKGLLYAPAQDDLASCAAMLALADSLHKKRLRKKAMFLFTTAEESGLNGAIHLCNKNSIPKAASVIGLETSKYLGHVPLGKGVVVRVGDKANIFHNGLTRFMTDTAAGMKKRDKSSAYQRALMDGGSCESGIYQDFGYVTGALALPLGNYHNRDMAKGKIAPEIIAVKDLAGEAKLLLELVKNSTRLPAYLNTLKPSVSLKKRPLGEFLYKITDRDVQASARVARTALNRFRD